jgi:hypothetical protein
VRKRANASKSALRANSLRDLACNSAAPSVDPTRDKLDAAPDTVIVTYVPGDKSELNHAGPEIILVRTDSVAGLRGLELPNVIFKKPLKYWANSLWFAEHCGT